MAFLEELQEQTLIEHLKTPHNDFLEIEKLLEKYLRKGIHRGIPRKFLGRIAGELQRDGTFLSNENER